MYDAYAPYLFNDLIIYIYIHILLYINKHTYIHVNIIMFLSKFDKKLLCNKRAIN